MGGTEERRRGFVAEAQRLFDCFNQVEAATGSIFILFLVMGGHKAEVPKASPDVRFRR
jgi:hypothetical protein